MAVWGSGTIDEGRVRAGKMRDRGLRQAGNGFLNQQPFQIATAITFVSIEAGKLSLENSNSLPQVGRYEAENTS